MAKIKLNQLVGEFLDEINGGAAEFARAYRMAVRANRKMKMDLTGKVETVCLTLNSALIVEIPEDSIRVEKVGIMNEQTGKIMGLTENKSLSFNTGCHMEDEEEEESDELDLGRRNEFSFGDDRFDQYIGESLGKGGYRNIGEYRISEEEGIIVFSPEFCHSDVTLEYISNKDNDGDVCVNALVGEAIIAEIRNKWHIAKKGTTGFDKQFYKHESKVEKNNARFRLKKPKLQDMNRFARQSNKFLKS